MRKGEREKQRAGVVVDRGSGKDQGYGVDWYVPELIGSDGR